ncbi:MAG: hypothetical protein WBQ21_13880 [Solirubrobacteraceae bacterium]
MASSKRSRNKKLHERARKVKRASASVRADSPAVIPSRPPISEPRESDYVLLFITESDLDLPESTLRQLRAIARRLPFEAAMLDVALLQARIEPVLDDPLGHWRVAQRFYAGRTGLLDRYGRVLRRRPGMVIFSVQALTVLMRLLIYHAREEPLRSLTSFERKMLQDVVLGAHSFDTAFVASGAPERDDKLAYELQAETFFQRPQRLEEMARHRELFRLSTSDARLDSSKNRVPVDEWLAASEMTADEQWIAGFGLAAITHAFGDAVAPLGLASHVDDLLIKVGLPEVSRSLPVLSSSRAEFRDAFAALGGGNETLAWELRPFKATPFLRLTSGDLLLLSPPWMLSWLGEGFYYRALTYAQQSEGSSSSGKYTRFAGEVVERYALDLAEAAAPLNVRVIGDQAYGKGGGRLTSDVAVVSGRDLILVEVHARRVAATAAIVGTTAEATKEVSTLLVDKINQVGGSVHALLTGCATLPLVDMDEIERIWPVVVAVGQVRQSENLWGYLRETIDPDKTASLTADRVQPLQVLDIEGYEKLMGLLEAGESLPEMLRRKTGGQFRDRDFAVWLHQDSAAPSDEVRLSVLEARWEKMSNEVTRAVELADEIRRKSGA